MLCTVTLHPKLKGALSGVSLALKPSLPFTELIQPSQKLA
jgi:hypothetical protein